MTRGEAINARATAGARMVEARSLWKQFRMPAYPKQIRDHYAERLTVAEINYAAAMGVESLTHESD